VDARNLLNVAVVFHERAVLRVEWLCRHPDSRLTAGSLVSIRWLGRPTSTLGAIRIARLVKLERPEASLNPFDTVPHAWVRDRALVARAGCFWEGLGRPLQHLFNAVFWDSKRFQRYLEGPSSLHGHHNDRNGNFRHALEVAERARTLGSHHAEVHLPVLIAGSLLHDAGKAEEYQFNPVRGRYEMTERGALLGHKHTVLEWIAAARAQHRVIVPEAHYLALLHAITAAKGAPDWLGLREPLSLDAHILSTVDRLSGQADLVSRHAARDGGFGAYHRHLGGRPYVVRE
ncbi:HD domain-containing protein, partial [Zoogloea ramigera]|uniref:HD domain-containing protein n=1 Tax=Zoogloea ramigera TaxID=350 RepID=UPI00114172F4